MAAPLTEVRLNEPITRHLRPDFARLDIGQTVGEALADLRQHPPPGRIVYFYVTDPDGRLAGVVPTRRLLLSPPDTPLADIMIRRVIALPDSATVLDACEFFTLHRLLAFPVVDAERRVIGVVDVELYTDELSGLDDRGDDRERAHDLFQLVGVHLAEARQGSPLGSFRRRTLGAGVRVDGRATRHPKPAAATRAGSTSVRVPSAGRPARRGRPSR
jgi:magnesium transporter